MIALDASALLAFMFGEPGGEQVAAALGDSCLSTVNLAETAGRFVRDGHPAELVMARIAATAIEIVDFDREQARNAAALLPATRPKGLSLGDRACLALAQTRSIAVLTADRAWLDLAVSIDIRAIR